ncbi:mannose-6-phosphate isomerase, class I [Cellulomonas sp. JZ18]|uniref:mannose-6-phosphate isomerase, class I n=1 Tax=Cellulomonas sp. JZ18 TaxID=2654191 RepID=UPI0012D3DB66|nr:mannose-6-phosphate isomerase, class I [Cellulomonas sp. JZ18]QGQ18868.1 mannose-6-phosphate isomerase, class I [Cellulomonas sp. JZ18]
MRAIDPVLQHYAWGSTTAIPEALGSVPDGTPVAEAWFGAHSSAPSPVHVDGGPTTLDRFLVRDPRRTLGDDVVARFGGRLPYLLKLVAAAAPLSLQVHPTREQASAGFDAEEARGLAVDDPRRSYKDRNHKPELVYALSHFEALVGFRAPRRTAEILAGVDHPVAERLLELVTADATSEGVRAAFTELVGPETRPAPEEVDALAQVFARRLRDGSPSPRTDRAVATLAAAYPGDPGAVTAVLLNPVTLRPGEACFVPAGAVHAYLQGSAIEVMANSDNVLRAGLTSKHVDIPELLRTVDCVAAPPIRIAAERSFDATEVFYAPVDDFELSVTRLTDGRPARLPGVGPRIVLCLEGTCSLSADGGEHLEVRSGQAVFVEAADGPLVVQGFGQLVQASVP